MPRYNRSVYLKKFRHLSLCKPYSFIFNRYCQFYFIIFRFKYHDFCCHILIIPFKQTESFECLSKFIPSLTIQNLLQKTNYKCNKNIYLCIYSFSYMLHMQLVQHSIIFPVLFYLNLHFSLLIRVIQNPSIITIFTIHIPKIHSFTFWNCFISFP